MLTEEEIREGKEIASRIDRTMGEPVERLTETLVAGGLERWEVAFGFLFAAFQIASTLEDDFEKVHTTQSLARTAVRLSNRAQQLPEPDDLMDP
jgi:hypothetical protein